MLEQRFPCFSNEEESAEVLGATRVAGAALPPPTALAGSSHPITMTYSHGLWKDKEEDAGPPVCLFLLSEGGVSAMLPLAQCSPPSREDVWETHSCPPTHGMGTAPPQHRPIPTTRKGPARAHLQPLHRATQGS